MIVLFYEKFLFGRFREDDVLSSCIPMTDVLSSCIPMIHVVS